ncbi:MAG: FAD-dependent thymidylate synthase [bacterium]|nr:FAD-dependent thymidylate synthase [bacterium]
MINPHAKVVILDGSEDAELLNAIADDSEVAKTIRQSGLGAEERAMLQALYSRSPKSVIEHLRKVVKSGAGCFMEQFYIQYGHKSIGDCGFITIFVEGCSMLVAKALQDTRLYNGQEASTRYLNFSVVPFLNPLETNEGQKIIDTWRSFYERGTNNTELRGNLKQRFPKQADENDKTYERAISARTFDIMRGFLPFSATTFVAWTTNLRQAADRLEILRHHPLAEIREVVELIFDNLRKRYPKSFSHKIRPEQNAYWEKVNESVYYQPAYDPGFSFQHLICQRDLNRYANLFANRPNHADLPNFLESLGQIHITFMLDGGSWRDLQRHRACIIRVPLFETKWGFYPWYLEQLTPILKEEAENIINLQIKRINNLDADPITKQYYLAMGFSAPMRIVGGLPAIVYLLELRCSKTVHPTLRQRAQEMAKAFITAFPIIKIYADLNPHDWDIKRGTQTITDADGRAISD